jgi:nucleotide-binding universal stress UspA family protein
MIDARPNAAYGEWSSPPMVKLMNVVVATDGSDAAISAAQRSVNLLRPSAHVVLVMVIPEYEDPMEDAGGIEGPAISYERAEKDWKQANSEGQAALNRTAAVLEPKVEVRLVPDDEGAGAAIVRVASEINADVLVVGSSGKGWLGRLFRGSVSDYVAHHAPCPVLLIRHDH